MIDRLSEGSKIMGKVRVEVFVTLKDTVVDPQGAVVKRSLESLGYSMVEKVRVGKFIVIDFNMDNLQEAEKVVEEMCRKLLANPVIEDYKFKVKRI